MDKCTDNFCFPEIFSVFLTPIITAGEFLRNPPGFYTFPVARSPKRGRSNHRCLEIWQKSSEKSRKIAKISIFESWGVGVCFHFVKSATTKTPKLHFRPGQPAKFGGENPPSEVRMERSWPIWKQLGNLKNVLENLRFHEKLKNA